MQVVKVQFLSIVLNIFYEGIFFHWSKTYISHNPPVSLIIAHKAFCAPPSVAMINIFTRDELEQEYIIFNLIYSHVGPITHLNQFWRWVIMMRDCGFHKPKLVNGDFSSTFWTQPSGAVVVWFGDSLFRIRIVFV